MNLFLCHKKIFYLIFFKKKNLKIMSKENYSPTEIVIEQHNRSREDVSSDTSSVRGRGRLKALTKKVIAANRLLSGM
jgi:hypothetical protein